MCFFFSSPNHGHLKSLDKKINYKFFTYLIKLQILYIQENSKPEANSAVKRVKASIHGGFSCANIIHACHVS